MREQLRAALTEAIDSFRRDRDFAGFYAIKDELLAAFDAATDVTTAARLWAWVEEVGAARGDEDWGVFGASVQISTEHLASGDAAPLPELRWGEAGAGAAGGPGATKLGGDPDWLQEPPPAQAFPACEDCDAPLRFVAQIDAPGAWSWADAPRFYLFACPACGGAHATAQSH